MRIAIDARSAVGGGKTGVGYYTTHLVSLLPIVDPDSTYVAWHLDARPFGPAPHRELFDAARTAANAESVRTHIPTRLFQPLSMRFAVPRIEWFLRFDVLFAPNFVPPPTKRATVVLTIHDLAFTRYPRAVPMATARWLIRLETAIRRAARIIVVSEQTRDDLLDAYPIDRDRVRVVPLAVDSEVFLPASTDRIRAVRERMGIKAPYLLSLSGIEPRKNLPALVKAYAALPDTVRPALVIAGPEGREGGRKLRAVLEGLPSRIREDILLTGYLSEPDKVALLSGAEAMVYPSLYEGFGLPILEAMSCGTPVLTSNVSALPATAGGAAMLVDPHDTEAISQGMERVLVDGALRKNLRAAGRVRARSFAWADTARQTAAVLREAGEDQLDG